jgi:pyruvate dehydrogenase E2 component (dihydrolipoamide acetyltransferase)
VSAATVAIPMPHLGVSVTEGTVIAWHKAVGDAVEADELVCEIATDKVDTEVYAPASGVLARIVAGEGETAAVGDPLAELAVSGEPASAPAAPEAGANEPAAAEPQRPAVAAPVPRSRTRGPASAEPRKFDPVAAAEALLPAGGRRNGAPACSPVARRVASEHGIDLGAVRGSGIRGRIRKADVLAVVEARAAAPAPAAGDPLRGYDDVPRELVPLTRQRSLMAEHMIRSRQTAAHMTTETEVDMSAVERARAQTNEARVAAGERKLTALAFVARATCSALAEFPDLNASFDGQQLIRWREVNLGIAVDTEQGLIVPVIRGCERLDTPAIGDAIAELAALARSRKLTPDHVRAGTFTISNPGSVGAVSAMAIINQPQVAILGTPAIVRRPVVVTDAHGQEAIGIRPVMELALTFDHRVIDGAYATRCVVRIKELLESLEPTVEGHSTAP